VLVSGPSLVPAVRFGRILRHSRRAGARRRRRRFAVRRGGEDGQPGVGRQIAPVARQSRTATASNSRQLAFARQARLVAPASALSCSASLAARSQERGLRPPWFLASVLATIAEDGMV